MAVKTSAGISSSSVVYGDSNNLDAFQRLRVSEITSLANISQHVHAWDGLIDVEKIGTGDVVYDNPNSRRVLTTSADEDAIICQTFPRSPYQAGKALSHGEPVLTNKGWVNIEDIQIGDLVFDGKGQLTPVTGVYPQGMRDILRVTFGDGIYVDCDKDHLWKLLQTSQNTHPGKSFVLSAQEILDKYGSTPVCQKRVKIPRSPVLEIQEKPVPIDPYTLGVILGDGHIQKHGSVSVTSADPEILEHLKCDKLTKRKSKYGYGVFGLSKKIKALDLNGKVAKDKFIPNEYKLNSREVRLSILQGLMDTDGTVDKRSGCAYYCTISDKLADDVEFLAQSLGGEVRRRIKEPFYYKDGYRIYCNRAHILHLRLPFNPFKLSRKASMWKRKNNTLDKFIYSIKPIGRSLATCIRVKSEDHTFLTKGCTVTHNSQQILMTFANLTPEDNVIKRIGYFSSPGSLTPFDDNKDGLFLESSNGVMSINIYKSGEVVESTSQADWNIDSFGAGSVNSSGFEINWDNCQILQVDFQYLGVGRVRWNLVIDGIVLPFHESLHANNRDTVYMQSPDQPLRWEVRQTGAGSGSFNFICASVGTEGSINKLGDSRAVNTGNTALSFPLSGTEYAVLGIRLQDGKPAAEVNHISTSVLITSNNKDARWSLVLNPVMTSGLTYTPIQDSSIEYAVGGNQYVITSGTFFYNEVITADIVSISPFETLRKIGVAIDGTQDELVLGVTPLSTNIDVFAAMNASELT